MKYTMRTSKLAYDRGRGMKRPTRHCDECEHSDWDFRPLAGSKTVSWFHVCAKGHKPRFYATKGPLNCYEAGYKRKCEDYKDRNWVAK